MLIIGLTGGIGSGKSAAASCFSTLGITVVDADEASRYVVQNNASALSAIATYFGKQVLNNDGSLNRSLLREKVFHNTAERKWLEALLHPLINQHCQMLLQSATSPYAILASPLLIEAKQKNLVQRIAVVDCPEPLQLQRAAQRDGNSREQIEAIMAAQLSRKARLLYADDIIDNSGDPQHLQQQVMQLHHYYLQLAANND